MDGRILCMWLGWAARFPSEGEPGQRSPSSARLRWRFLCLEACDFVYVCALPFCSSHCVWLSMARQQSVARALLGYARGSGAGVGV